jgi:hypothetical protein
MLQVKNFLLLLSFLSLVTPELLAQDHVTYTDRSDRVIDYGVGLGTVIAVAISWSRNRSVLLAILHGIFGWLYVIYYLITRNQGPAK